MSLQRNAVRNVGWLTCILFVSTTFVTAAESLDENVSSATQTPKLVFSNTAGKSVIGLGASETGELIADDIMLSVGAGCTLDRYTTRVSGNRDGGGTGTFSVSMGLYATCPGAGSVTPIPGTECTFVLADAGVYELTCIPPPAVDLPASFYFGVSFDRDHCGVQAGAPATQGFSADAYDSPSHPCQASLGGYPEFPHASFYLEVYADGACTDAFPGYKNNLASGGAFSPGPDTLFADDLSLGGPLCNMVAYEVAVRGEGTLQIDLRENLDDANPGTGGLIDSTRKFLASDTSDVSIVRFEFDPPILLPGNLWITFSTSSINVGPIVTDQQASIGATTDLYARFDGTQWVIEPFQSSTYAAFDVTVFCEGALPVGACCDMVNTDSQGEAVCREVPEMNCGLPELWREGESCASVCEGGENAGNACTRQADCPGNSCSGGGRDGLSCNPDADECPDGSCVRAECPGPFPHPCGVSACCTRNDSCFNLTESECNALEPIAALRQFTRSEYCNEAGFQCPLGVCLDREGDCVVPHVNPGCEDPECCTQVCAYDFFCCVVSWDATCAYNSYSICTSPPKNDECWSSAPTQGARLVGVPSSSQSDALHATEGFTEPGFCCHGESPGAKGYGTVWYKFVAPETSVKLTTCGSNSPARDSLLQVFSVADPDRGVCGDSSPCSVATQDCIDGSACVLDERYACENLNVIGCSDDVPTCGLGDTGSSVCVTGLNPGETYYALVGSKVEPPPGASSMAFRFNVSAPCSLDEPPILNDVCQHAVPLDGELVAQPFDMTGGGVTAAATFGCPGDDCLGTILQTDLWYDWTAPATDSTRVSTCDARLFPTFQPATVIVVYHGCDCPVEFGSAVGCSDGVGGACGLSAEVVFDAVEGECYKIRLGGHDGGTPSGQLRIDQVGGAHDCNQNGIPDSQDIANGTSDDCNESGVPDECELDADGDGTIDDCDDCPSDPFKITPGICGCGITDDDTDSDGVEDCNDGCPSDPLKTEPGICGCGVADDDADGDGTEDCNDGCPNDPLKTAPGICGCGVADNDADGDGVQDCHDECPDDPLKTAPGVCGCGVADDDTDGDGVEDCIDNCPNVENADQADANDDGTGDACGGGEIPAVSTWGLALTVLLLLTVARLRFRRYSRTA